MPKERLSAGRAVMSTPSLINRPEVGRSKPAMIMRNVVLPEPEGPSSVRNSPGATSSDTFRSASKLPKALPIPTALRPTARVFTSLHLLKRRP